MELDNTSAIIVDTFVSRNVTLTLFPCLFVELPDTRVDCAPNDTNLCVACPILGRFVTGGGLEEYGSVGHVVSLIEWIVTVIIGVFGTFTNILIITIIQRQNSGRAFDLLLVALACFDLIGSVTSVIAASASTAVFENWDRGISAHYLIYIGTCTSFMARSGSSFMTVLITAERYIVIAFPITSNTWFTKAKTKCLILSVFIFAILMAIPRFMSYQVVSSDHLKDIPSMSSFDYIVLGTAWEYFWYVKMAGFFDKIDFWVPLPILLILNVLIYIEIRKFASKRKAMNIKQAKDIRAAKMFVPVVIVLFLCNIVPYVHYYLIIVEHYIYREGFLGVCLSIAINSAVNLPIYYFKGSGFRKELKGLLSTCLCCVLIAKKMGDSKGNSTAMSALASTSQSEGNSKAKPESAYV